MVYLHLIVIFGCWQFGNDGLNPTLQALSNDRHLGNLREALAEVEDSEHKMIIGQSGFGFISGSNMYLTILGYNFKDLWEHRSFRTVGHCHPLLRGSEERLSHAEYYNSDNV